MEESEWISEQDLARQIARSYYLETGVQLDPEVFLAEIQRKFNPHHDPDDGRFTYGPGGTGNGGRSAMTATRPRSGLPPYPVRVDTRPYPARVELPESKPIKTARTKLADDRKRPITPIRRFRHSPGIDLPDEVVSKANTLSDAVRTATGHQLHVTSGRRPPHRQAAAMYQRFVTDSVANYANQTAFQEVRRAYLTGSKRGLSRDQTIAMMTGVLTEQTKRGIYLSRHMRSGAIDIRSPSTVVLHAIRKHPSVQSVLVENDHIHIQFH